MRRTMSINTSEPAWGPPPGLWTALSMRLPNIAVLVEPSRSFVK